MFTASAYYLGWSISCNLLHSFMSYIFFGAHSWRFSTCKNMSFANSSTSCIQLCIPFTSFSCLTALVKISSTMLNSTGETLWISIWNLESFTGFGGRAVCIYVCLCGHQFSGNWCLPLNLLLHEHGISLHLLWSFASWQFYHSLFSLWRSCTFSVKSYFKLFLILLWLAEWWCPPNSPKDDHSLIPGNCKMHSY